MRGKPFYYLLIAASQRQTAPKTGWTTFLLSLDCCSQLIEVKGEYQIAPDFLLSLDCCRRLCLPRGRRQREPTFYYLLIAAAEAGQRAGGPRWAFYYLLIAAMSSANALSRVATALSTIS